MADEDLSKLKIDKSKTTIRQGSSKKLFYWISAIFLILIIMLLYIKGVFTFAVQVDIATVSQVYPAQTFALLNASGYVVPQRKAAVASKITGKILSLHVEEGSKVKKGEVIAKLENDDIVALEKQAAANLEAARSNLEQYKAELKDAGINFTREKNLLEKEFTTKASYDSAEARYKKAAAAVTGGEASVKSYAAALENTRVTLGYATIRAPFDAIVLTKNADIGDIITPLGAAANAKAAVVTIADMDSLQVEADVSESNLEKIRVGQPCEIQLDAFPDSRFRGIIHMIVPTADRSKATVMVKVRFIGKDIRILPEMSAKVAFLSKSVSEADEKPRTLIGNKAIVELSGKKMVFLVKGNSVTQTPVTTGRTFGEMIEITNGINAGDKIVTTPSNKLRNGSKIKVIER
ncbi:MAG: efflux RND transporter periplasmic adaptor subunit [Proteobacteria bacterium]|nr:efflux RND transporter periplasmic adaptor subunit [Pseudomonadota bacterium]